MSEVSDVVEVSCPWCDAWLLLEIEQLGRPFVRCTECGTTVDSRSEDAEGLAEAA